MGRIQGQLADHRDLAIRALLWISCSRRPLSAHELQHALAVKKGTSTFDEENITELSLITSVCAGLVAMDENSNIIRLVHYTVQEYFERKKDEWFSKAQEEISVACITYLSFNNFESGPCLSDKDFEN
jgi:hypothetical protein